MPDTIEIQWQRFAAAVFKGLNPSKTQFEETRKAFYAGVWALSCTMQALTNPAISEDDALAYMSSIQAECEEFFRDNLRKYLRSN